MKYVIISNRLPVTVSAKGGKPRMARSGGGLATGLDSLKTKAKRHWVGWAGVHVEEEDQRQTIRSRLAQKSLHPVFLRPDHIQNYYEGYSNSTLWPLCHYFSSYVSCNEAYWKAYKEVNELFCEEALKIIDPGDVVWIHDYHLMLLPGLIRERAPDACIGYFHHIPFPSYEIFRCLPERADILRGLLGADLVAFHTHDYMRHCLNGLYRALNLECHLDEVQLESRVVRVEAFPMGINYDMFHEAITLPKARAFAEKLSRLAGGSKVILSVDRLDYSKGLLLRLEAFADFLEHNPEYRGKVTLLMVVVPSRDTVERYAELKTAIDEKIGAINGAFAAVGWVPIHYFYRSFSFAELAAMYHVADIALVTPLRDGMNLVAKEYLAAKRDHPGVLILSEMAGAAVELSEAVIVNPASTREIENALLKALAMPEEEQAAALSSMQKDLSHRTVERWAGDFITELRKVRKRNDDLQTKVLEENSMREILGAYTAANNRLLVLDYDGTLAPFTENPAKAHPTPALRALLTALAADRRNTVAVCSGRDKETLERWLGDLDIGLAAEHGVFYKEGGAWYGNMPAIVWDEEILGIIEQIQEMTPLSRIERKKTALVWHYRQVDNWLADLRVNQLVNSLIGPCARLGLQIMRGKKIIEIKPAEYSKATEIYRRLKERNYDFIMAMGDDVTDEDMFAALPPEAFAIKVGQFSDMARYTIPSQRQVLPFLAGLAGSAVSGRSLNFSPL